MRQFIFYCSLLFTAIDIKTNLTLQGGVKQADSSLSIVSVEISKVNPGEALELATEALLISRDIRYSKGKAMSCFYIGQVLSYLGNYQKSLEYLSFAEQERYSKDNPVIRSEIGRIKDKQERDRFTSLAYKNLGMAYDLIWENPDSSLYWMKKNEQLLSTMTLYRSGLANLMATNIRNELPGFYTRMAEIYSGRDEGDSARWYREKLQQVSTELEKARNKAEEKAFLTLLGKERKMSQLKLQKIIFLMVILFVAVSLISGITYRQLVIKKKKKEILTLKQKLSDTLEEVIELAKMNSIAFLPRFNKAYPEFSHNLLAQHSDLTNTELRLSALIYLNFSSKEIADCMFITHRSAQTSKSRLRKKLGIPRETDLYQYFKSFT